jgi:polyisoprenoid-binding protein YceI
VVTGNLSLIGVTRPVRLTFDLLDRTVSDGLRLSAGRIRAMGVLRRTDWGMTALVPAVSDEVRLDIEVEAQAAR